MNDGPRLPHVPAVPGLSGFSVLARGGYATVYRATQDSVGRDVAVKVENRTLESDRDQRRFLREARAAGRMSSHPHVVDLFDAGVTVDQQPYLIMELCDGSYADRMRGVPLTAVEARDLGVKIADALAHAHQSGVLHRDVKPANILHQRFNSAVLADFGLAVLAEVRDSSVTLEVLTPAYAPPEMFRHSAPSPAVDVYALCATLYAVMRGKPPRWRDDRNPSLITLMEMFAEPIPDLPGIPHELVDVLRAGMANDPGARPYAEQLRDLLVVVPLPPGPVAPTSGGPSLLGPISGGPISGGPISGGPISGGPISGGPISGGPSYGGPSYGGPSYGGAGFAGAGFVGPGFVGPGFGGPGQDGHSPGESSSGPGTSDPGEPGHGGSDPGAPPGPTPEGTPSDNTPTVRTRRRRWSWLFGGFGALALLATAGAAAWVVAGGPVPRPSPSSTGRATPGPAASRWSGPGQAGSAVPSAVALSGCLGGWAGGRRGWVASPHLLLPVVPDQ